MTTRSRRRHLLALLAVLGLWPGRGTATQTADPALPIWMAGCWAGGTGDERFHERWTAPDDHTLIGLGYTVKAGRMTAFDYFRVVVREGRAVYVAQPGGVPPTEFRAASMVTATDVVFENAAHDYPKRVAYQRLDTTHLTAWIDGGASGGRRVTFAMQRETCQP